MTTTVTEIATVTPIRREADEPRYLAHRKHDVEPAASQPIAHLEWAIEQRLTVLADRGESPYAALVLLGSEVQARACSALDAVFEAAQELADRANCGQGAGPVYLYEDAYSDALYDLAQIVRGCSA